MGSRTFPNDPNPPPVVPEARASSGTPTAVTTVAPADAPPAPLAPSPAAAPSIFRVVRRPDGTMGAFELSSDLSETPLGDLTPDDAEALNAVSTFDPSTNTWDAPEATVRSLVQGHKGLTAELWGRVQGGEASLVKMGLGTAFLARKLSPEDAVAHGKAELVKARLNQQPALAWKGLGGAAASTARVLTHPQEALRFAAGEAAEQLPLLERGLEAAARGAAKGMAAGATAAALGSLTGPVAPAAIITGAAGVGAAFESWKFFTDLEAGSTAIDMLEAGHDPKVVQEWAPIAGVLKGSLEMASYGVMAAPFKRGFIKTVLNSDTFKKAAASWVGQYSASLGAEISTEMAQTKIDQVVNNWAAEVEGRPALLQSAEKAKDELWATFVKTLAGTAAIGAVGPTVEKVVDTRLKALDEKALEEGKKMVAEAEGAQPRSIEALPPPPQPVAAAAVAPATPASSALEPVTPVREGEVAVDPRARVAGILKQVADAEGIHPEVKASLAEALADGTPSALISAAHDALDVAQNANPEAARALGSAVDKLQEALDTGALDDVGVEQATPAAEAAAPQTTESILAEADAILEDAEDVPTPPSPRSAKTSSEKVQDAKVKAARAALNTELTAAEQAFSDYSALFKDAVAKHGPVHLVVEKMKVVKAQIARIKADLEFYSTAAAKLEPVGPKEALEFKTPTLDAVLKIGFTEGRKESKARAQRIVDIAKGAGLTLSDVRRLLANKRPELMGDAGFHNFMEGYDRTDEETGAVTHIPGFIERVQRRVEQKRSLNALRLVLADKKIRNERNLRKALGLPRLSEMTVQQINDYVKVLDGLEDNDVILTPRRIKALKETHGPLKGAKTMREVKAWASKRLATPLELFKIKLKEFHFWAPSSHLNEPGTKLLAHMARATGVTAEQNYDTFREVHDELAAKALASRRALQPFWRNVADWLVPQQKDIMTYVESDISDTLTDLERGLTAEELEYAEFLRQFYHGAYAWLRIKSRFEDSYAPHNPRPLSEIIKGIKGREDMKKALKELWERLQGQDAKLSVFDKNGRELPFAQFFRYSQRRSGKLTPTLNLMDSTRVYAKRFHLKQALDEFLPIAKTIAELVEMETRDPEAGAILKRDYETFVNEYVNAKKGNAKWAWIKGEEVERVIRFGMTMAAIQHIAFSIKIQGAAWVGEEAAKYMALGLEKELLAKKRKRTAQGKAILEKYSGAVGEGPWAQIIAPGATFEQKLNQIAYGTFRFNRIRTMEDLLLGNMTEEEFAAGEISDERIASIELEAGRWIDVHGLKSIRGSSVAGAGIEQFKGWMIPPFITISQDAFAVAEALKSGKPITEQVRQDMRRLLVLGAVATLGTFGTKTLADDDDGLVGDLVRNMSRELWSSFQALTLPANLLRGAVPWMSFYTDLGYLLLLMAPVSRDEDGALQFEQPTFAQSGEKKWPAQMKRMAPVGARQLMERD